jgi:PAS domain S-box-containing protein
MVETSDGRVWLGTHDKGLFYLDHGQISPVRLPGSSHYVRSLLPREKGDLWIGTERGIFHWNGKEVTQVGVSPGLRQIDARAMICDRDANVWIATASGLVRVNDERISFGEVGSDRAKPVTALFEDREGNLWIGHSQGLGRLRETAFVTYPFRKPQEESGGPVFVDASGRVWFASFKGGLQWLRQGQSGVVLNWDLNQDVVYSITGDDNELWVGRQRGGLTRLRYGTGRITARTYTVSDGLPENSIYAVYRSRDGSVWAATVNAGIGQFVDGRFKTYSTANGLSSNSITSIAESPDGTMWFGTPNGLVKYSKNKWTVFTSRDGLSNENITSLLTDTTGTLWIGTVSGLTLLQSGVIKKPDSMPPSLQEEILGIAEDNLGNLWIATSNHILSVKRAPLLSGRIGESDVREYGLEDGLIGQQGVKRFRSVSADSHGKIWFSTDRGLAVVDPLRVDRESAPVIVQLESLSADGNSLDLVSPIRVPPDTHRLTFKFSGLSLSDPKRIQFKYKLEGFDRDWSEPVSTREAIYTHVDWGSYVFRVVASNSDGIWNDRAAELSFSIAPTWYQTRVFRILLAASLLLGIWALHRRRIHQLRNQEKRLRDVVETIPAMTFTALSNGFCTFVNKRWTEYTGLSVERTLGPSWQRAIHPEDLARHSEKWRISVATGQSFEDEARFRRAADGEYRWFLVRGVPLRDRRGKIRRWYGTLTDIEDRKCAEQGREKLRQLEAGLAHMNRVSMMGEMAASLAHEIKQPIAAAINSANSCIEWLAHDPPNLDRARASATRINKYGNRAAEIIDRIRAFYKKSPPQRELVDVNRIIQGMFALLESEAARSSVTVRTELVAELPLVMADSVQLQQVFMNLMLNAIEAMKDSGGELTVASQLEQDGQLLFSVSDTGPGLPAGSVDQIFSAFFTTKSNGSGMGLAISRSIVEAYGGRLWADANNGQGATFHFTLPTHLTELALVS